MRTLSAHDAAGPTLLDNPRSVLSRVLSAFRLVGDVFAEARELQRQARLRYRFIED